MGVIVQTNDLTKFYEPSTRALDGVDIKVEEGEWISIMGPSGSGKTTLLNIIGCLDRPTSGNVKIGETDVTSLHQKELTKFRRENLGYIFQQFHLVPYLTALENVELAQYLLYGKSAEMDRAVLALERVGLKNRLDHTPAQLSGGEQQRVSIARALVNEPRMLLADEPTGNLDRRNGDNVLELLKSLHSEGHTILLITHDIHVGKLGERIVKMLDGKIYQDESQNLEDEREIVA